MEKSFFETRLEEFIQATNEGRSKDYYWKGMEMGVEEVEEEVDAG